MTYADGVRTSQTGTDVDDAYAWETLTRNYDADGVITAATKLYDDGRVYETTYVDGIRSSQAGTDVEDVYVWDMREIQFDDFGNRVNLITTYDDGTKSTIYYDDFMLA